MTARAYLRIALVLAYVFAAIGMRAQGGALNLTELAAPGQGLYTATVADSFSAVGSGGIDDWSFEAEIGDRLTVRIETAVGASRPKVRLLNQGGTTLRSVDGGTNGVAEFHSFQVTAPGTLRVRVFTDHQVSAYTLRVDLSRFGPTLETEANDLPDTANFPAFAVAGGAASNARFHGTLPASDAADFVALGELNVGATIDLTTVLPTGTSLTSGDMGYQLWRQRRSEGSVSFSGSQFATIPHSSVFDDIETNRLMTIEAWVFIRSFPSGWFTIFNKHEATGDWGWELSVENNSNGLQLWTGNNVRRVSGIQIPTGRWTHVAVTYNPAAAVTTERVRFFVNGALASQGTSPGNLTDTSGEPAYIGFSPTGGDEFSNGMVSELRLWNVVRTPAEIAAAQMGQLAGTETGLVGYWRFDEGQGTTSDDRSPNDNVAVFGGGDPLYLPAWGVGAIKRLTIGGDRPVFPVSSYSGTPGQTGGLNYFDDGATQLTDGILGSDNYSTDLGNGAAYEWVGWNTVDPTYTFNFASPQPVRYVEIGFNRYQSSGIYLPASVTVNGTSYPVDPDALPDNTRGFLSFPVPGSGNSSAITVTMADAGNSQWTFVDEVRFTGSSPSGTSLVHPVAEAGAFYAAVTAAGGKGIGARYLLTPTLTDPVALAVTATSLPAEGATTDDYLRTFSVTFNAQLNEVSAVDPANYSLRSPGPNAVYGDGDDIVYTLGTPVYDTLRTVTFTLGTAPVQAGPVRFTVNSTLTNRFGTAMTGSFTRNFSVILLNSPAGPIQIENLSNDTPATATPLAVANPALPSGSFSQTVNSYDVRQPAGSGTFRPVAVAMGKLRGPAAPLDVVVANESNNSVSVMFGNGDGTLAPAVRYATQNYPWQVRLADVEGDGDLDIFVGNRNSDSISVLRNAGDGTFAAAENISFTDSPAWFVVRDLNGDGRLDLAAAGYSPNQVGIRMNNGDGTFAAMTTFAAPGGPNALDAGDVDGDGDLDLVVTLYSNRTFQTFLNNGSGVFTAGALTANTTIVDDEMESLILADMDGDGVLDVVGHSDDRRTCGVYRGVGNGTFLPPVPWYTPEDWDNYKHFIMDVDLDGRPDIISSGVRRWGVSYNLSTVGNPRFTASNWRDSGYYAMGAAGGDLNGDGLPDIAVVTRDSELVRVYLGEPRRLLPLDVGGGSAAGVRTVSGRGMISTESDQDWWSFTANAGERILITTANINDSGNQGLRYRLYLSSISNDNYILDAVATSQGTAQFYMTAPVTGTYYFQVSQYWAFRGEYRFQIGITPERFAFEVEGNNDRGSATSIPFTQTAGRQTSSAVGYLIGDESSDYLRLGNLDPGTQITLSLAKPPSSTLSWQLEVWNASAGTPVAQGAVDQAVLNYTVPVGGNSFYYARIVRANTYPNYRSSIYSQWQLEVTLDDAGAPSITASTLPTEGTVFTTGVVNSFNLTFSEDMDAAPVNSLASYELRWSGPNGTLDDGDDLVLPLVLTGAYTSGLTVGLRPENVPLMPGLYRFTASTALRDRALNPMAAAFVRGWSIQAPSGSYVFEGLDANDATNSATALVPTTPEPSGSWEATVASFDVRPTPSGSYDPSTVRLARLRGPAQPFDAVVVNQTNDSITVLPGNNDGTFGTAVRYPIADNPWDARVADFDGDGDLDIVSAGRNNDTLSLLKNNGDGTFAAAVSTPVNDHPSYLGVGDLNGDGRPDVVTSGYYANVVGIRLNAGDGSFGPQATVAVSGGPNGLDLGDLDGDGDVDIAVPAYDERRIQILVNNGAGTFTAGPSIAVATNNNDTLEVVCIGDLDGDGIADIVAQSNTRNINHVLRGLGGLTYAAPVEYRTSQDWDNYRLTLADYNLDGRLDIISTNVNRVAVVINRSTPGTLLFSDPNWIDLGYYQMGVDVADINSDGRPDIVASRRDSETIRVLLGRGRQWLPEDVGAGSAAGFRTVFARGNVSSAGDVDWWTFSAEAGQRILLSTVNPTNAGSAGLRFRVYLPSFSSSNYILDTVNNATGGTAYWGMTAPVTGTYYVQVSQWYEYRGEYRFQVTTAPSEWQPEAESNGTRGSANAPAFARLTGQQLAKVTGVLLADDDGDFFNLGNLAEGTVITLNAAKPPSSNLQWVLEVFNASGGSPVAASAVGAASLQHVVPAGQSGAFYARIRIGSAFPSLPDSLFSQYQLTLTLADVAPPSITGSSLPAEGANLVSQYVDSFSLSFSEDMESGSVNSIANYELLWAGPDATIGTGDDVAVPLALTSAYSAGLSVSLRPVQTPILPGLYRFRALTGLVDRYLNPLNAQFVRSWTIEGPSGSWVFEGLASNNALNVPVALGPNGASHAGFFGPDAGFVDARPTPGSGDYRPADASLVRMRGAGQPLDIVFLNENDSSITLRLGNGDGTFQPATRHPVQSFPWALRTPDMNGDGLPDAVTVNRNSHSISVLLNNGAGSFAPAIHYPIPTGCSWFDVGDLNGDGRPDVVASCQSAAQLHIRLNNGDGSLAAGVNYAQTGTPNGVTVVDVDNDADQDVVIALWDARSFRIMVNDGTGTLTSGATTPWATENNDNFETVVAGDLDGDGLPDLVTSTHTRDQLGVWKGNGDGTFTLVTTASAFSDWDVYKLLIGDYNNDGKKDIIVGNAYYMTFIENLSTVGSFRFAAPNWRRFSAFGALGQALGDINGDGLTDAVLPWRDTHGAYLLFGTTGITLPSDSSVGSAAGVVAASGRGNLTNDSDEDWYVFSARAGERIQVHTAFAATVTGTYLRYRLYTDSQSSENYLLDTITDDRGSAQWSFTAPHSGRYYLQVSPYSSYRGEYRFRVTTFPASMQLEGESNNTRGEANAPTFARSIGSQTFTVAGALIGLDTNDYYQLGNLGTATQVQLSLARPPSSTLSWVLELWNASSGSPVVAAAADAPTLSYTIPEGAAAFYYARVRIGTAYANSAASLFSQYQLTATLTDSAAPIVVSTNLPAAGVPTSGLLDRWSVTFSEDLETVSANALANYELRSAGPDSTFDTSDDSVLPFAAAPGYSSGLTLNLRLAGGALQPGRYRFSVGSGLLNRYLNPLTPYASEFVVAGVSGYQNELEANDSIATGTVLAQSNDQVGQLLAGGRGFLLSNSDHDYYRFDAEAGDRILLFTETPGNPGATGLYYALYNPAGTALGEWNTDYYGSMEVAPVTAPATGTYALRIREWYGYRGEYRFRVLVLRGVTPDTEANGTIATATPLPLGTSGDGVAGTAGGLAYGNADFDYYNLGTVNAGSTIYVSSRKSPVSPLVPVVGVYSAAGSLVAEASGGRSGDGVAQVPIGTTATYYALIRPSGTTHGILSDYLLDVLILPTGGATFPNLVATWVTPLAASGLRSGDTAPISFRVDNVGSTGTGVVSWTDRIVLSTDAIYGNGDDIEVAAIPRTNPLASGGSYTVSQNVRIPDGISGTFNLIVRIDAGNTLNEFILEGDNDTTADTAIAVTLADYPDLRPEDFVLTGPDGSGNYSVTWTLANRGSGAAPLPFSERIFVRNNTTSSVLVNSTVPAAAPLVAGATLARSANFTTLVPGTYTVEITVDSGSNLYEFTTGGNLVAEQNNIATGSFSILRSYTISVSADPAVAGNVSGGGTYPEGASRTVTATPIPPNTFIGWFEGAFLRSSAQNYSFTLNSDRTLVARFSLPQYLLATQTAPMGAGTVTGGGVYTLGATANLSVTAAPGYTFLNWTEGGTPLGSSGTLALTVNGPRTIVANFSETNPTHVITTETSPAGVAAVTGAGTVGNGIPVVFTAPATVVDGDTEYVFQRFTLNGTQVSTSTTFSRTFTTLDAPAISVVAVYTGRSLKPSVVSAVGSLANPVGVSRDFRLSIRFDRSMDTNIPPVVTFQGAGAPTVPITGTWASTSLSNDTWQTSLFQFVAGQDGTWPVSVSVARDTQGRVMEPAVPSSIVVDTIAPAVPSVSVTGFSSSTATLSWTGYSAPADLASFRIFRQPAPFTSTVGLSPVASTAAAARTHVLGGLTPDTDYHVAVVAVDAAGNAATAVTPVLVRIVSSVPPPVPASVSASSLTTARVSWNGYDTSGLIGFDGFQVFRAEASFTDVTGMTPIATVAAGVRTYDDPGRDRTVTYYYAVVGVNRLGQRQTAVTPVAWTDPLGAPITTSLTIGGAGEEIIPVFNNLEILAGATLTIRAGTTLRFATETGIVVSAGRLVTQGTPLSPVLLTSDQDDGNAANGSPAAGQWEGVLLNDASRTSSLAHTWIKYGRGLRLTAGTVTLDTLSSVWNSGAGLFLTGAGVSLTTSGHYLAFNGTGASVAAGATLNLTGSVLKNNTAFNASNLGGTFTAGGNWWGNSSQAVFLPTISGIVNTSAHLTSEPVLSSAIASATGSNTVGTRTVQVRIGSVNAALYALSEDSGFGDTVFQDIPGDEPFNSAPVDVPFQLSEGAGTKTLYLQLRSVTGGLGPVVTLNLNYVTDGPVITAFSLTEGQQITRPLQVTGSATAVLGLSQMRFLVGETPVATSPTSPLGFLWDVRTLTAGTYRVRLEARDNVLNLATRTLNVQVNPQPPPKPVITAPANNTFLVATTVNVTGTAEPGIEVRLSRNASLIGSTLAAGNGAFSFANVPLVEGGNSLVATAVDSIGTNSSNTVSVVSDTQSPAAVNLLPIGYNVGQGVFVDWELPTSGEVPVSFRVFWHNAPFTTEAQATGSTPNATLRTDTVVPNLPDGTWHFGVIGYDGAGNAGPISNLRTFTHDGTRPTFSVSYVTSRGIDVMPVGPGDLTVNLTASEPLSADPLFLMRLANNALLSLRMTPTGPTTYTGTFPLTYLAAVSGTVNVGVSGTDLSGNTATGAPSGTTLVFDLTRPSGAVTTSLPPPVQTTDPVLLSVNLTLSEAPAAGTLPTLSFSAPAGGAATPIVLSGAGLSWSGTLNLTPAMGTGEGSFNLAVTDAAGNEGFGFTSGERLELYTGETPPAPGAPGSLTHQTRPGGVVRLTWAAATNALSYRLYREAGAGGSLPTVMIAENIAGLSHDDLPPEDGVFRYAVRGFRLGAEGPASNLSVALSDRTAPEAPATTTATLLNSGVRIEWTAPASGPTPSGYRIYRNGASLGTAVLPGMINDSPPRGVITYRVASYDPYGNEALGPEATVELFVGSPSNLTATADVGGPVQLSWTSGDATTTGYHVYRNGIRQTAAPITATSFVDSQPRDDASVVLLSVTAVNASAQESAPRTVEINPLAITVSMNPSESGPQASQAFYFDLYRVSVQSAAGANLLRFSGGSVARTVVGAPPLNIGFPLPSTLAAGASHSVDVAVPAPTVTNVSQVLQVTLNQTTDLGGSTVAYRFTTTTAGAISEGIQLKLSAAGQQPLAGGLANFTVQAFNRGFMPMDLVLSRGNNTQPGELVIQIFQGDLLVSEHEVMTTAAGIILNEGAGYLRVAPGGSVLIPVTGVLVPAALEGETDITFVARFRTIYNAYGSSYQRSTGQLIGDMPSNLRETPYYGTASSAQTVFSGETPVTITGQAIDRATGNPVPNVPLRIGVLVQGAKLFNFVTTDGSGNYTFQYTPTFGIAGTLQLWAAHPEVVDLLNQVRVDYYRIFTKPGRADIVMSKNDHLDFDIALLNLGDNIIAGADMTFRAFRMDGETEVPVPQLTGALRVPIASPIGARAEVPVRLRLTAAADAPDAALVEFTLTTPEGASATFRGSVSLRQPVPVLSVTEPSAGYALVSVNRGGQTSVDITVVNRGLRDLEGVTIVPPATVPWMQLNLAPGSTGPIAIPNIPIGGSRTISVVVTPPAETPVGFYDDFILIRGTNAVSDFRVNIYGRVTSDATGTAEFDVSNILGDPVPNATLSLRHGVIGTERGPVTTDVNGLATFTDLMEGDWQWRISAPGHGSASGVVKVIAGETVLQPIELSLSLVTVKFNVVPVPFTDYYEIKIEQTFQTFTPVPNLVMTPPHQSLSVERGFVGTLIYKLKNTGLRSAFDVKITGQSFPTMRLTPLISYMPELAAQQEVEIPTLFEYFGPEDAEGGSSGSFASAGAPGLTYTASVGGGKGGKPTGDLGGVQVQGVGDLLPPGPAQDLVKCYEDFKYGTITLTAAGGVNSITGTPYTVGVNATIDVDELISILCDGDCPDSWTGGAGAVSVVADFVCDKALGFLTGLAQEAFKPYDIVCKATNIIKALACLAAQVSGSPGSFSGGGTGGGGGGGGGCWCGGGPGITYSGCFAPGTAIRMADGTTMAVENLQVGALLGDQSGSPNRIANLVRKTSDHLRELSLQSEDGSVRTLRLTHDHRLWVEGIGWLASEHVTSSLRLRGADGRPVRVLSNVRIPGSHPVVLVHMAGDSVLFAEGVLAEDQCEGADRKARFNFNTGGLR